MPPKLTPQQVIGLSQRGPLSVQDVQQLASGGYNAMVPQAPTPQGVTQRFQGATSQDQSANFGNALRDLLTKAQGMGTANSHSKALTLKTSKTNARHTQPLALLVLLQASKLAHATQRHQHLILLSKAHGRAHRRSQSN